MASDRRKNRVEQFRQQSTAQFRNLEILVLREIEQNHAKRTDLKYTFTDTLAKVKIPGASPEAFHQVTRFGFVGASLLAMLGDRVASKVAPTFSNQAGASSGVLDPKGIN